MNREDYEVMINDLIADFTEIIFAAAERNRYKDQCEYWRYSDMPPAVDYVKGWENFDLIPKLKEEYEEVMKNTCIKELGDLGWVLVMMFDQIKTAEEMKL